MSYARNLFWFRLRLQLQAQSLLHQIKVGLKRLLHWCEHCGATPAELTDSRTMYHHVPGLLKRDPNRKVRLCAACTKYHHEYWDAEWREYHGSLGLYL
jgi:hypothetical protein